MRQEEIWHLLSEPSFATQEVFPSQIQLEYVRSLNRPIISESSLRNFERDTVEIPVQKLVDAAHGNLLPRKSLDLRGTVIFKSDTDHGNVGENISERLEGLSLAGDMTGDVAACKARQVVRGKRKGKGDRADQFCIYKTSDGTDI